MGSTLGGLGFQDVQGRVWMSLRKTQIAKEMAFGLKKESRK